MAVSQFLSAVKARLSGSARVLTDASSKDFKLALGRWTDLNHKTPGAIVQVATEDDIINTVKLAATYNVPFVAKSGGHSAWSTIGPEGTIIDLSNFSNVIVDKSKQTVRVQGGVVNKQLIQALYDEGLVVPLGGGNTIGSIPQALGGGICALTKICGNTGDNIISARLITASGELQIVDKTTPDLLWAIKGAGQFFGLVTELELKAYPIEILGSDDGTVWTGTYIFDISKVGEVAKVAEKLMDDKEHNSAGLAVITLNPHTGDPCMLLMSFFFGSTSDAEKLFAPIVALGPAMAMSSRLAYTNVNDGIDPFCVKGGFKRFYLAGVPRFDSGPWEEIAQVFVDLTKECEDVESGGFGFEWVTGTQKKIEDSAWAHAGLKCWLENLSWYSNPESGPAVDEAEKKAVALETRHVRQEEVHTYQNFSRDSTLESRFGGKERVERLKALKRKWDPTGVFTKQLLED